LPATLAAAFWDSFFLAEGKKKNMDISLMGSHSVGGDPQQITTHVEFQSFWERRKKTFLHFLFVALRERQTKTAEAPPAAASVSRGANH
jgi:hypothetical protein